MSLDAKISALEDLARAWTEAGITWAVTNGLDDYPKGIGRDLDIVIERGALLDAVAVTIENLSSQGWTVLPNRQGWIWWIVAFRRGGAGEIESLQVDLFEHLQWAFTWVIDGVARDGCLVTRGPFLEDSGGRVAKRFLVHALSGGIQTFRKKPSYIEITSAEEKALSPLLARVSGRKWPEIIDALKNKDLVSLEPLLRPFRKACFVHSFSPRQFGRRFFSALQKQWVVNWFPSQGAPVISIQIVDEEVGQQVLAKVMEELKTLVYQDVKIVDRTHHLSARSLRRLSCLQVILVFYKVRVPRPMTIDLKIQQEKQDVQISRRGQEDQQLISKEGIRSTLMNYFTDYAAELIKRHQR